MPTESVIGTMFRSAATSWNAKRISCAACTNANAITSRRGHTGSSRNATKAVRPRISCAACTNANAITSRRGHTGSSRNATKAVRPVYVNCWSSINSIGGTMKNALAAGRKCAGDVERRAYIRSSDRDRGRHQRRRERPLLAARLAQTQRRRRQRHCEAGGGEIETDRVHSAPEALRNAHASRHPLVVDAAAALRAHREVAAAPGDVDRARAVLVDRHVALPG